MGPDRLSLFRVSRNKSLSLAATMDPVSIGDNNGKKAGHWRLRAWHTTCLPVMKTEPQKIPNFMIVVSSKEHFALAMHHSVNDHGFCATFPRHASIMSS